MKRSRARSPRLAARRVLVARRLRPRAVGRAPDRGSARSGSRPTPRRSPSSTGTSCAEPARRTGVRAEWTTSRTDGDAARFLRETGLTPREDIDTVVLAMSPRRRSPRGDGLVLFEGRFDLARIGSALTARGAALQQSAGRRLLPARRGHGPTSDDGAVALVNPDLDRRGQRGRGRRRRSARRESGGAGGLMSGPGPRQAALASRPGRLGLGARRPGALSERIRREGRRGTESPRRRSSERDEVGVAPGAAGDRARRRRGRRRPPACRATPRTASLLEDSLRGVLAMWRLAVQEKSPELVSVIRRFRIDTDDDGVSISGTLPGSFLALRSPRQPGRESDEKD